MPGSSDVSGTGLYEKGCGMAATQNSEPNGVLKVRLRTIWLVVSIAAALAAIGGYAFSYAQAEARSELRLAAVEKKVGQHEAALLEVKNVVVELRLSVRELNSHLEWIKKEIEREKKRP